MKKAILSILFFLFISCIPCLVFSADVYYFNASPSTVTQGSPTTLSWSAGGFTAYIYPDVGSVSLFGSTTVYPDTIPTATYTLHVDDIWGAPALRTVTVTVLPPPTPPAVDITVNTSTISCGDTALLTWTSTNATTCTIDNGIGSVDESGSRSISPSGRTTYTITATGSGGTATDTVEINVIPTVTLSVDDEMIPFGGKTTLEWNSGCASSCVIEPGLGAVGARGAREIAPTETTTYLITATNAFGQEATASVTIAVAPAIILSAYPEIIQSGDSATLSWSVLNADTCSIQPAVNGITELDPVSGTIDVTPLENTTYEITATGPGGTTRASVMVKLPPVVNLSVYPEAVSSGGSAILTWCATNATSCSIEPGIGEVDANDTYTLESVTEPTTYTITARGPGGTATESKEVRVIPSVNLKCSNARAGGPVRLSWTASNSELCYIQPADPAFGPEEISGQGSSASPQGTALVYLEYPEYFTVSATGTNPPSQDSETVYVSEPFLDGFTKLLIHSDDIEGSTTIHDLKGHSVYRYGDVHHSTTKARYGHSSLYLDGQGDCLRIPYSSDFDFIGNLNSPSAFNYTIDLWFRSDEGTSEKCLISKGNRYYPDGFDITAAYNPATGSIYIRFYQYSVSIGMSSVPSDYSVENSGFGHLTIERRGLYRLDYYRMMCLLTIYFNGSILYQTYAYTTVSPLSYQDRYLRIGVDQFGGNYFKGYIDEIRISKGIARSQDPFDLLYRVGNNCFLPPESPHYHPVVSLEAVPQVLAKGESATLVWRSSGNATSTTIDQGVGTVGPNGTGSVVLTPQGTTTYTISSIGQYGNASDSITVPVTLSNSTPGYGSLVKTDDGGSGEITFTINLPGGGAGISSVKLRDEVGIDITDQATVTESAVILTIASPVDGKEYHYALDVEDSSGSTNTYVFVFTADTTVPVTTASMLSGEYASPLTVELTCSEDATIYYSTDGDPPYEGAPNTIAFKGPIQLVIDKCTNLQFFALDAAGNRENIKSEIYLVGERQPEWLAAIIASIYNEQTHQVDLTWTTPEDYTGATVTGYYIYRCISDFDREILNKSHQGGYAPPSRLRISQNPLAGTSFSDGTAMAGVTYWYGATYVTDNGIESPVSELVSVSIDATSPAQTCNEAIARAKAYLEMTQNKKGYWDEKESRRLLSTSQALNAFNAAGSISPALRQALLYLRGTPADNNDYLARKILTLHKYGQNVDDFVYRLQSMGQLHNVHIPDSDPIPTRVWGTQIHFAPDPIDTVLASMALKCTSRDIEHTDYFRFNMVQNILESTEPDCYGWMPGDAPSVYVSSLVSGLIGNVVLSALTGIDAWIANQKHEVTATEIYYCSEEAINSATSLIDTAAVLLWIKYLVTEGPADILRAMMNPDPPLSDNELLSLYSWIIGLDHYEKNYACNYLIAHQDLNGSWNNDSYVTSLCLEAILSAID